MSAMRTPASASVGLPTLPMCCVRMYHANSARLPTGQVGKLLGERWKALNDKQRAPYEAKAAADKKRYETEKASYNVSSLLLRNYGRSPGWFSRMTTNNTSYRLMARRRSLLKQMQSFLARAFTAMPHVNTRSYPSWSRGSRYDVNSRETCLYERIGVFL